ncbi:hypothetical protein D1164_04440 [Mariniphaga sediminis]|uniref:Uncharacterized protein n=1 Tax=Mariniphaga sediminis TaxID=1628158 RepID=A0A399D2G9_9BACT|nr:hypothetical protein D1164_04440 [Mariniphaga sediminis]
MNKSYLLLIITKTTKVLTTALFLCMLLKCQTEEVSLPIQLEAEIQHVTEFGGSDGSIDLTATGGREPFRFLWSLPTPSKTYPEYRQGSIRLRFPINHLKQ